MSTSPTHTHAPKRKLPTPRLSHSSIGWTTTLAELRRTAFGSNMPILGHSGPVTQLHFRVRSLKSTSLVKGRRRAIKVQLDKCLRTHTTGGGGSRAQGRLRRKRTTLTDSYVHEHACMPMVNSRHSEHGMPEVFYRPVLGDALREVSANDSCSTELTLDLLSEKA